MIDLEQFQNKFTGSGFRVMERALTQARRRDHNQVTPEHVLLALTGVERDLFTQVMQDLGVNPGVVTASFEDQLAAREHPAQELYMSEALRLLLKHALDRSRQRRRRRIDATDLFYGLFVERSGFPVEVLESLGAKPEIVMERITARAHDRDEPEDR